MDGMDLGKVPSSHLSLVDFGQDSLASSVQSVSGPLFNQINWEIPGTNLFSYQERVSIKF